MYDYNEEASDDKCECESCCSSCCHEEEPDNKAQEKSESDNMIKTLQQQKEEILKKRQEQKQAQEKKQIPKPEPAKDEPFNPFAQKKEEPKKEEKKAEKPAENQEESQVGKFRVFKGLQIMDKKIGNGPVAKRGHKVKVSYVLRLNN